VSDWRTHIEDEPVREDRGSFSGTASAPLPRLHQLAAAAPINVDFRDDPVLAALRRYHGIEGVPDDGTAMGHTVSAPARSMGYSEVLAPQEEEAAATPRTNVSAPRTRTPSPERAESRVSGSRASARQEASQIQAAPSSSGTVRGREQEDELQRTQPQPPAGYMPELQQKQLQEMHRHLQEQQKLLLLKHEQLNKKTAELDAGYVKDVPGKVEEVQMEDAQANVGCTLSLFGGMGFFGWLMGRGREAKALPAEVKPVPLPVKPDRVPCVGGPAAIGCGVASAPSHRGSDPFLFGAGSGATASTRCSNRQADASTTATAAAASDTATNATQRQADKDGEATQAAPQPAAPPPHGIRPCSQQEVDAAGHPPSRGPRDAAAVNTAAAAQQAGAAATPVPPRPPMHQAVAEPVHPDPDLGVEVDALPSFASAPGGALFGLGLGRTGHACVAGGQPALATELGLPSPLSDGQRRRVLIGLRARAVAREDLATPYAVLPMQAAGGSTGAWVVWSDPLAGQSSQSRRARSLAETLRQPQSRSWRLGTARHICSALAGIHLLKRSHGSLAPRSIWVTPDSTTGILETGLVGALIEAGIVDTQDLLASQLGVEFARYLAPEGWDVGCRGGPAADMWSLGLILLEVLGAVPGPPHAECTTLLQLCSQVLPLHLQKPPTVDENSVFGTLPQVTRRIILACLDHTPSARPDAQKVLFGLAAPGDERPSAGLGGEEQMVKTGTDRILPGEKGPVLGAGMNIMDVTTSSGSGANAFMGGSGSASSHPSSHGAVEKDNMATMPSNGHKFGHDRSTGGKEAQRMATGSSSTGSNFGAPMPPQISTQLSSEASSGQHGDWSAPLQPQPPPVVTPPPPPAAKQPTPQRHRSKTPVRASRHQAPPPPPAAVRPQPQEQQLYQQQQQNLQRVDSRPPSPPGGPPRARNSGARPSESARGHSATRTHSQNRRPKPQNWPPDPPVYRGRVTP